MPKTRPKWTPAHRANFNAAMQRRRETKVSIPTSIPYAGGELPLPSSKSAEYIVYRGSVYKRINKIKVVR
jgi:hypothetical protein